MVVSLFLSKFNVIFCSWLPLSELLVFIVFRRSGTIRAPTRWDVRGRKAMLWVVWWTWMNVPWWLHWMGSCYLMAEAQNWLPKTLRSVMVRCLNNVVKWKWIIHTVSSFKRNSPIQPSYFSWCLRAVASGQCWSEPGGEAKLWPLRGFSSVLHCLWPTGGISPICCQHGQRPSSVDELATASV